MHISITTSFKLGPALASTDNFAVALCRLLAATNDVIYQQKLTIIARARADAAAGPDKMIINNETGYCVRMLFGHLYEAGLAFRGLDDTYRDRIDSIIAADDQAKEALSALRQMYGDVSDTGFYKKVLGCVRNLAGFHYKDATFKEGLEALKNTDAIMIISEHIGFTRYVVSDVIMTAKVMGCIGGEANFHKMLGAAYKLADALAIGVTHLLKDLFEKQNVATRDEPGEVQIPPEIAETRRRVNEERQRR